MIGQYMHCARPLCKGVHELMPDQQPSCRSLHMGHRTEHSVVLGSRLTSHFAMWLSCRLVDESVAETGVAIG